MTLDLDQTTTSYHSHSPRRSESTLSLRAARTTLHSIPTALHCTAHRPPLRTHELSPRLAAHTPSETASPATSLCLSLVRRERFSLFQPVATRSTPTYHLSQTADYHHELLRRGRTTFRERLLYCECLPLSLARANKHVHR